MVAVIVPHSQPRRVVPGHDRPGLRVIEGGRSRRGPIRAEGRATRPLHPAVYRRRRIGVLMSVLVVAAVVWLAVIGAASVAQGPMAAGPTAMQAASGATASPAPVRSYVVKPGDTLWTVARHLQPSGDVRHLVDALAERNGGASLQVGQSLQLDGLGL